ncbi:MAG: response regulator [Acidimicrobiia bacterium]|nr:response regulator [Acidimicrobiia bacterium]
MGIEPDIASDGAACLDAMQAAHYDLIFMDIHMPRMDGLDTTAAILERHPDPNDRPRIIAMTANALDGDRERFLALAWTLTSLSPFALTRLSGRFGRFCPCRPASVLESNRRVRGCRALTAIAKTSLLVTALRPLPRRTLGTAHSQRQMRLRGQNLSTTWDSARCLGSPIGRCFSS